MGNYSGRRVVVIVGMKPRHVLLHQQDMVAPTEEEEHEGQIHPFRGRTDERHSEEASRFLAGGLMAVLVLCATVEEAGTVL